MKPPSLRRPLAWVPLGMLGAAVALYGFSTVWIGSDIGYRDWAYLRHVCRPTHAALLIGVPLIGGLARMVFGNPRSQPAYARWLGATPWRPGRRLPLGPIVWAWEDVAALVPLALLARLDVDLPWYAPVVPYVVARATGAALSAARSDRRAAAAGVAFVAPLLLLAWPWNGAMAAALVALAAADTLAIRAAMSNFPWDPTDPNARPGRWPIGSITWPTNAVGPVPVPQPVPVGWCVALPLLLGWWAWSLIHALPWANDWRDAPDWRSAMATAGGVLVLWRVVAYCGRYHPPINLRGRLFTGRLVVPGYDRVLVTPTIAVLGTLFIPGWVQLVGGSPALALAVELAAVAAVLLVGGPTLRSWQLTGHHRILRGLPPAARQQARQPLSFTQR